MVTVHEVAIVGAGAMGCAAAWALTRAGRDVVVLEQYELGHARGGSHGATRIFRVGTEQSDYLDLAERARGLWADLASESGAELLTLTGAIEHGMSLAAAEEFSDLLRSRSVDHEVLVAGAAAERWPGMRFAGPVLHQTGGGVLHADRALASMQQLAIRDGATVRARTRVDRVSVSDAAAPIVLEAEGDTVRAQRLIVTVGPWTHKLLGGVVPLPAITVTQEQPRVFEPSDESHQWPCFVHWRDDGGDWGRRESYGLYEAGAGVKVGLHASGPEVDPDRRDFAPESMRDATLHAYVREWFPGLDPDRSTPISCLYDNTDSGDFVIDRLGPITVAAGFNGEGFKFVPVIGELLRDLALDVAEPLPMFTVARHLS